MPDVASGFVVKAGLEILNRVTPKGLAWVKTKFIGRDILVLGQPRAGKTSFIRYFQYGLFAERETRKTRLNRKTAAFTIGMGRDQSLKLQVRRAVDTVGQVSAAHHATLLKKYKPHVAMIILDMNGPWEGSNEHSSEYYFDEFCEFAADTYRTSYLLRRKLKAIIVVLNKRDKATDRKFAKWVAACKATINKRLSTSIGPTRCSITVMDCSLIKSFDEGHRANAVIEEIAVSLENS